MPAVTRQSLPSEVRAVTSSDGAYPARLLQRLGRGAPTQLYTAGDPVLLSTPSLGIVGSRSIDEPSAAVAQAAARRAVAAGWSVVSGGARGIDQLAMAAAQAAGGKVTAVLVGLAERTRRDPSIREAIAGGTVCLCSPYPPAAAFSVGRAMGRNKVIYALSQQTVVIACQSGRGGTWTGSAEALRRGLAPVWVWTGRGAAPGNAALVQLGALPIDDIDQLELTMSEPSPTEPASQLALEL